jgi:hypothetical protein
MLVPVLEGAMATGAAGERSKAARTAGANEEGDGEGVGHRAATAEGACCCNLVAVRVEVLGGTIRGGQDAVEESGRGETQLQSKDIARAAYAAYDYAANVLLLLQIRAAVVLQQCWRRYCTQKAYFQWQWTKLVKPVRRIV